MVIWHSGHFFSVGAGAGTGSFFFKLFMTLMTMKIQKATIVKLITVFRKRPYLRVTASAQPAALIYRYQRQP